MSAWMKMRKTAFGGGLSAMSAFPAAGWGGYGMELCAFGAAPQPRQARGPAGAEFGGPAFVDPLNRRRVEPQPLFTAHPLRRDQAATLQRRQVLHHCEAADLAFEAFAHAADIAAGLAREQVQDAAAPLRRQGEERGVQRIGLLVGRKAQMCLHGHISSASRQSQWGQRIGNCGAQRQGPGLQSSTSPVSGGRPRVNMAISRRLVGEYA